MDSIRPARSAADWDEATALLHDYVEWLHTATGIDLRTTQPGFAAELECPACFYGGTDRVLFLAYLREVAVGTVAVVCHDDGTAELKRMYVRPIARGRGIADRLVRRVLETAADAGCRTIWLETKPVVMDAAIAVYRRNGFEPLPGGGRTLDVDGLLVMEQRLRHERDCA